jgi:putative ABC transport system permease protein
MRIEALLHFYRLRLRTHPVQELLAGAGIAVGVALVFAVVVANTSITTSASQIARGIAGQAKLQLDARDEHGFSAQLLPLVRSLPSVQHAAGIMEQRTILAGPHGRASVALIGVDASLAGLGGRLTQDFTASHGLILRDSLLVPSGVEHAIGTLRDGGSDRFVVMRLRGRSIRVPVGAVVGSDVIGPLSGALVVVAPLSYVDRLAALPGRLTRVFVEPRPGQEEAARRELTALAQGRITVSPVDRESRILAQASAPNDQSTGLFAAISAIVGLLLAFNAMLLTVPERRRAIAELRTHGYTPAQIVLMVAFDALVLGSLASGVGLVAGLVLAHTAFHGVPTYLAFAFPFGAQQTVPTSTILLCLLGGLLATFLAAAQPLLDLLPSRAPDEVYREEGEPGQALGRVARRLIGLAAMTLLAGTTLIVGISPSATVVGVALLALSTLLTLPAVLGAVIAGADRMAASHSRLNMVVVAVMALRSTRVRAIALAATGAVAVFGSVSIEGAHRDLVRGLHRSFVEYLGTAGLWVTTGGNDLTTENFPADGAMARIRKAPGVAAVRPYYGGLLDIGERRAWVIARSTHDHAMLPAGEVVAGDAARADASLRRGGTVAVSEQLAAAQHANVGQAFALPTPMGVKRYRLVATLTNLGWGPGAVVVNATDYRRDWGGRDPTAFEVDLRPGASPVAVKRAIEQAIGPALALRVQTADERIAQYDRLAAAGLHRLTQISVLLLVAAAIALAAATGAAIWQRRSSFADYRLHGFLPRQLWSALLIESALVLAIGCGTGAITGLYGHLLLGRWLRLTTGFPAPFAPSLGAVLSTFAVVTTAALFVIAVPSYRAAKAPPSSGLQY